jgi:nicotinate-nucleotide adenylyltransferase
MVSDIGMNAAAVVAGNAKICYRSTGIVGQGIVPAILFIPIPAFSRGPKFIRWRTFMRIGVFGGSFDPVHYGHLILADMAREAASLDQVRFVPAAISPLKKSGPVATPRQRLEMLDLAIGGNPAFQVDKRELDREGVSYTVETLEQLNQENPDDELFLIVGSDVLPQFHRWRQPARILELAIPLIGARRHSEIDFDCLAAFTGPARLARIREHAFEFPWIEISGTDIRQRVAAQKSIRYRLPRAVECFIENARLYR